MNLTAEEIAIIKNHFSEIPKNMEIFKSLIDVKIDDENKKKVLLAMIDKFEIDIEGIKTIIETM